MEVCLQMAIIFIGKQFVLSIVEYHLPRLWKLYNTMKVSEKNPLIVATRVHLTQDQKIISRLV